jgi:hypothetical protein
MKMVVLCQVSAYSGKHPAKTIKYTIWHPVTMQDPAQSAHRNIQEEVLTMQDLSGICI